jgi:hypothetical protein
MTAISSRAWKWATVDYSCGSCGERRAISTPVLRITLANVKRVLLRCPLCADEAVPDDMLVKPVRDINRDLGFLPKSPTSLTPLRSIRVPFDYKQKAAGD